jgi:hypothetical protein
MQALIGSTWLPVKSLDSGWTKSDACSNPDLGMKSSLAWVLVRMDPGTTYRWVFTGDVNIANRDSQGRGISKSTTIPIPIPILSPHPVSGNYGITWENVASRVNDISAAAWSDAQATIARNQGKPSALDNFSYYISPGATSTDPQVSEAVTLLKRTFALFANIPSASKVFFVAMTRDEIPATYQQIQGMYSSPKLITDGFDSIYGINGSQVTSYTHATCQGSDGLRNNSTYPDTTLAAAVTLDVCPGNGNDNHLYGVHGIAHEYIHTVQAAILPNGAHHSYEPCWMTEGQPEWGQAVISSDFQTYLQNQHLHPAYSTQAGTEYSQVTKQVWSESDVESYLQSASISASCWQSNQFGFAYTLGEATIETLVSIGGSESFFALEERLAASETMNQAFQEVYGITWDSALPILSQVVAQKITYAQGPQALTYQTLPTS